MPSPQERSTMTLAPSDDRAETAPDRSTAHEKAVDRVMGDRDMVSRLLREHQMLHEAFEHGPVAWAILDAGGAPVASNALHDRLDSGENAGAAWRTDEYELPSGLTARVCVDIGAEKSREEALARARDEAETANRARGDFLASMSHEIRTPMSGLIGMAGLLAESELSEGQQRYADLILRSGRALLEITTDILDLSKIEAGQMTLDCAPFDIADSIEDTATLFAANADAKGLDLIVRIDPAMPQMLVGDGSRLRQVMANLIGNAIKFTETGHVMVDVDARTGAGEAGGRVARLTCRVQDTGSGIAPDMCERIFERFSQVGHGVRRMREGTGLGLAIVAALVDQMGGAVGVESIEGEGTTFHFIVELPVAEPDAVRMARETLWGKRVMIVDAEGPCRAILAESLKAWGFDVASCRGLREAMALMDALEAQGRGIDLVLLGERVAEGEAPLFMAALADRAGTPPPVILIARLASLSRDGACGKGPVPFDTLPRPVRSACLLASVERALEGRMALTVVEDAEGKRGATARLTRPAPVLRIEGPTGGAGISETAPEPSPAPEDTGPEEATGKEGAVDILVAEDNEINRFLIEEILRESGYSYRIAHDGVEAMEAWRESRPRLILMDVSMPRMSGDEATRAIRSEERGTVRTPIVALTAHALRGDRDRCIEAGMDDHLTKPVTIASITTMIDFYLTPPAADAVG